MALRRWRPGHAGGRGRAGAGQLREGGGPVDVLHGEIFYLWQCRSTACTLLSSLGYVFSFGPASHFQHFYEVLAPRLLVVYGEALAFSIFSSLQEVM